MVSIDLVTGFLGAGKTTFISRYGQWLERQGKRFAVVENEFGAAGVDSAFLSEQFGNVRELSGGCICCTLKSGFYQLLEELCGVCDRIVVEPSGLYNLDDFFEVTDGLERQGLSQPGMCITLVDPHALPLMNEAEKTILHDELIGSGCVVWSKADVPPAWDEETARWQVLDCMENHAEPITFYDTPTYLLADKDFAQLQSMTPVRRSHTRMLRDHQTFYQSATLRPMERFEPKVLLDVFQSIMADGSCGEILRIKGFVNGSEGSIAVNCTVSDHSAVPCPAQPAMLNIIGRGINRNRLKMLFFNIGMRQTE